MQANEVGNLGSEMTLIIDRAGRHLVCSQNTMGYRDTVIIFTESRRLVDDTCAIGVCDVGVDNHSEGFIFELI